MEQICPTTCAGSSIDYFPFQANYNHLKMDNFFSSKSDFGSGGKRRRTDDDSNKENSPHPFSLIRNYQYSCADSPLNTVGVNDDVVHSTPTSSCFTSRVSLTNISNHGGRSANYHNILDTSNNQNQSTTSPTKAGDARSCILGTSESCITTSLLAKKRVRRIKPKKIKESAAELFGEEPFSAEVLECEGKYNLEKSAISAHPDGLVYDDDELVLEAGLGSDSDDDEVIFPEEGTHTTIGYCSLGPPTEKCQKCGAIMWKEERVNKNVKHGTPEFSICCGKGQIKLPRAPPTPDYMMQLYNDPKKCNKFRRLIRLYNTMFAFSSMGGKVDHFINNGSSPYVYRLNGQNHHVFGSLIPNDGDDPKFCQLYIYDTDHEVENRMRWVNVADGETVNAEVVEGLFSMLDSTNELVKYFRMARDRFKEQPIQDLKIVMKVCRAVSGRENFIGPSNEVGAIMVGDLEDTCGERDIIIESKTDGLERISDIHPKLMALQYPLLFPNGEDGYHDDIPYVQTKNNGGKKRKRVTMKEFYAYKLWIRPDEGNTPRLGGRLFQQYIVDAFSAIEQARLWWFHTHQKNSTQ